MNIPFYLLYEMNHAAVGPIRAAADVARLQFRNPLNPVAHTPFGRGMAAACELFERLTRRYGKPTFGLDATVVEGERVAVHEQVVWERPFCQLLRFEKQFQEPRREPRLLIVAPMSGHYATLLRGTVEAMLPHFDVHITDWTDARMVPVAAGSFDLDDYIDYVVSMLHALGGDTHVMAVCQPSVPVLAAVALMEEARDPYAPISMTLMGGPIDTRENPTVVNRLAQERGTDWFRHNVITKVPFPHPGFLRDVYPGFLQLTGFMSMNLDRHIEAHRDLFMHLVRGDGDSAEKHREFYDEYMAVMDLTAEFYLQTVDTVFVRHALPRGRMTHRGRRVDLSKIRTVALMTVEGERDDISGVGQTRAAHRLCGNIPETMRTHHLQPKVGHYGVFNGSRFSAEIAPRIRDFILHHEHARLAGRETARRIRADSAALMSAALPAAEPDPARFLDAPQGAADDLTRISGIGPKLRRLLNGVGIYHFWQIAELEDGDVAALESQMGIAGRIRRGRWIEQAQDLALAISGKGASLVAGAGTRLANGTSRNGTSPCSPSENAENRGI